MNIFISISQIGIVFSEIARRIAQILLQKLLKCWAEEKLNSSIISERI